MAKIYSNVDGKLRVTNPIDYTAEEVTTMKKEIDEKKAEQDKILTSYNQQIQDIESKRDGEVGSLQAEIIELTEIVEQAEAKGVITE